MTGMGRGRRARAAAAVATATMAIALAGCWPAPGQGPDRQGHNPFETTLTVDSVGSLAEDWSVDLGDGPTGAPIVSPQGVHAQSGGVLHTVDRATGAARWDFDPELPVPGALMSDPVWQDGEVFAGYGYGNVGGHWEGRVFDAASGDPAARTLGGGLVDSLRGTRLAQSSVGFGSGGPIVVNLTVQGDIDDPSSRWTGVMQAGTVGDPVTRIPASAGTRGVYHSGVSILTAQPTGGNGVRMYTYARPANCLGGGTVFVPCAAWATPLDGSTATSPVVGPEEETLYVGTNAGTLYAVDATTGAVAWRAAVGAAVTASPALADGRLFVPTADGDLVVLAADGCGAPTCTAEWTARAGDNLTVQPAVAGGVVFTGAADGALRGYGAAGCGSASCTPLWSASAGGRVTGAPAVSGGRLHVGTQDGRLLAYAPAG